jgi:polysaccharide deacetylase family protein (PEP-CTERM system associated)
MKKTCLISFDVEDWFQVENLKGTIDKKDWEEKELRVEKNTQKLLQILDKSNTKATFFVLGWIAERIPELIKDIGRKGHEIASHGYEHELLYEIEEKQFREDIRKSKEILKDITGKNPIGYRAPNFSITDWAIKILKEEGFVYDSSLFPSDFHDRYGKIEGLKVNPNKRIFEIYKNFYEITIPVLKLMNRKVPWGGGGYFRILPYSIYKKGIKKILNDSSNFLFYLHPWELDPEQPKVRRIKWHYKLRHYTGLKSTENRLRKLLSDFDFVPLREIIEVYSRK